MSDLVKLKDKAAKLFAAQKAEEALAVWGEVLEADPDDVQAMAQIGDISAALGRAVEAIQAYREAAERYAADGLMLKAMTFCKHILAIDPAHTETQARLAELAQLRRPVGHPVARISKRPSVPIPASTSTVEALFRPEHRPSSPPAARTSSPPGESPLSANIPLFSELPKGAFIEILEQMKMHEVKAGEWIIREGAQGDSFFVLSTGRVRIEKSTPLGGQMVLAILREGAFFGEMALLSDSPRSASVIAEEDSKILELTRVLLDETQHRHPVVKKVLHDFYQQRLLETTVAVHPWFQQFSPSERRQLIARFRSRQFSAGSPLIQEGKAADGLYLLLKGTAEVTKRVDAQVHTLAKLEAGAMFGEMSLLSDRSTIASITTLSEALILRLDRASFDEVTAARPEVKEALIKLSEDRLESNRDTLAAGERLV